MQNIIKKDFSKKKLGIFKDAFSGLKPIPRLSRALKDLSKASRPRIVSVKFFNVCFESTQMFS